MKEALELLEFLDHRVEFLKGFGEDEDSLEVDGEEIYSAGVDEGRYKEAVFIRDKVAKMLAL